MMPLTFVTWKWPPAKGYRSTFGPETVNILRRMVARHYPDPFRFLCVTDDAKGLDAAIEVVPDWKDFATLPSPSGGRNPSCYRRLRAFHPDIAATFGPRFVCLDLDLVVLGDLRPVVHRSEEFVIFADTNPRTFYNGSLLLLTAGSRSKVWTTFDPVQSPKASRAAGHHGSDQGWISHCLGKGEATFTPADGVYSYQKHIAPSHGRVPKDARIVIFHGHVDPWSKEAQKLPWVQEAWC